MVLLLQNGGIKKRQRIVNIHFTKGKGLEDKREAKERCEEVVLGEEEGLVIWLDIVMIAPSVPRNFQLVIPMDGLPDEQD